MLRNSFEIVVVFFLLFVQVDMQFDGKVSVFNFTLHVDFDECHNSLCQNGGTCVNTYGDYRCECEHGYSGKNCHLGKYNCYVILNT